MSVETASYIDDLVATNPAVTDFLYEGDDHLRLIKAVLLASFPSIGGAVTLTHTELNAALMPTTAGQWTLMKDTTVSGAPSAVDFVNGTGGVVISSLYDQYLIVFTDLLSSSGTIDVRLAVSENAGSSFPAAAAGANYVHDSIASGVSTLAHVTNAGYMIVASIGTNTANASNGTVLIVRPLSGSVTSHVESKYSNRNGIACGSAIGGLASTTNQFDAVRLSTSASTFAGSTARVRFYGRRA